jgi:GNAT superfamily N-acetyltransferase
MSFIESIQPYRVCDIANVGRKSKQQPETSCGVYHFDCNAPVHNELITRFTKIATKQRHFFYEIFPWKSKCKKNWHMFIAMRQDPRTQDLVICAWCSVRYQELPNPADGVMHKTAYIVEVSVRRHKLEGTVDENYRGMGIELLKKIIEYSRTQGVSMLYLVPSNEYVKRLYIYSIDMSEVPDTSYLVKGLSDAVTVPMMNCIIGLKRSTEIAEETTLFEEELRRLPDDIRTRFTKKTELMQLDDKIAILGQIAIMMDEDVSEDEIHEFIDEI